MPSRPHRLAEFAALDLNGALAMRGKLIHDGRNVFSRERRLPACCTTASGGSPGRGQRLRASPGMAVCAS
jgi:hypothetical protein